VRTGTLGAACVSRKTESSGQRTTALTRKKPRRAATPKRDPRIARVKAPKARLRQLFELVGEVTGSAERLLLETENAQDNVVQLDVAVLLRGVNALKSIRLLAENGHWEFASSAVRQLFELVVNLEYLGAQPDRDAAAFRYAKFGLFQLVLNQYEAALYDQKTGRPVDEEHLAYLKGLLDNSFEEFRLEDRRGRKRRAPNWSGKSVWQLAELSTHPLRKDQYRLLFSTWSEQTHASPRALIDGFSRPAGETWLEDAVASDDIRISETVSIAVIFVFELWSLLPHVPPLDIDQSGEWRARLLAHARSLGAPAPVAPGSDAAADKSDA
jgi:hypothetical protein